MYSKENFFKQKTFGMKNFLLFLVLSSLASSLYTQHENIIRPKLPKLKKINDTLYEVYFKVNIQPGWHVYSQKQPTKGSQRKETIFNLQTEPNTTLMGSVREIGTIKEKMFKKEGLKIKYYEETVTFVQKVKVPRGNKVGIKGNYRYGYGNWLREDQVSMTFSGIPN